MQKVTVITLYAFVEKYRVEDYLLLNRDFEISKFLKSRFDFDLKVLTMTKYSKIFIKICTLVPKLLYFFQNSYLFHFIMHTITLSFVLSTLTILFNPQKLFMRCAYLFIY